MALLSELRSRSGSDNESLSQRKGLEREIAFKNELQHRFLRKLRNVCVRNKAEHAEEEFDVLKAIAGFGTDGLSDGIENPSDETSDGKGKKKKKDKH